MKQQQLIPAAGVLLAATLLWTGPAQASLVLSGLSPEGDTFGSSPADPYDLRAVEIHLLGTDLQVDIGFWSPVQLAMDGSQGLVLGVDIDFGIGGADPLPVELGLDSMPGFGSALRITAMDGDAAFFGFPGGTLTFLGAEAVGLVQPDLVRLTVPGLYFPADPGGIRAATVVAGNEWEPTDWMSASAPSPSPVPEPSSFVMMLGMFGCLTVARRWRQ